VYICTEEKKTKKKKQNKYGISLTWTKALELRTADVTIHMTITVSD